jgi:hypothetical protein
MEQNLNLRPEKVENAIKLLYMAIGFSVWAIILQAIRMREYLTDAFSLFLLLINPFISLGLMAFLVYKIRQGRNWARITWLILMLLGLPFALIAVLAFDPMKSIITVGQTIIQIVATVFLFQKPSSEWFQAMKAGK